ncbi:MAG TPA: HAMP domain-containing methyl-accepting chemotaxis protein, partial [Steroidobacteraceae bacterium]|nr:HAMP domain-containing methyl-accepting chemotaxis protein [Steroidobacteraceae bacterium]
IRLLLLLAVPLAALMVVGLAGLATINATGTTTVELQARLAQQDQLDVMRDAARADLLTALNGVSMNATNATKALDKLNEARTRFQAAAAAYVERAPEFRHDRAAATIKPIQEQFTRAVGAFENALLDENLPALRAALSGEPGTVMQQVIEQVDALRADERNGATQLIDRSRERGDSFFTLNAILGFVGLGLALLFGYYIGRSITAPVESLTATVRDVAAGNIEARSNVSGYDEIAVLGAALDQLLDEKVATLAKAEHDNAQLNDSVIALLRAVSQLSRRDLTVRVPVTEDVTGPVADAINQLANETGRVLVEVSRVADQVASASAQVKSKAETVNAVATTQQSEALDTAEKLNHASDRLNEIAKLAQQCNELAQRAAQNTESAVATVTGTLRGMTDIREVIQETGKRIKRLGERSQEISGIVDIINKIAERTTVLALNASMQAAAAGDAGRGFGVVADEVQRLAENTRNAAGQIGALIKSMQIETNDTIGTMENAIGQVVEGSKMAEVAGKQIGDTQGATTALVQSVREIAASSQEQAQLSVTLRDRARTMITGVRATGEQLTEQLEETVNLTDFARRLLDSVRVFKLPA